MAEKGGLPTSPAMETRAVNRPSESLQPAELSMHQYQPLLDPEQVDDLFAGFGTVNTEGGE
jgi:hypothetical protein